MSYRIAIPSHKRADILRQRTLPVLLGRGIKPDRITVFVPEGQQRDYAPVINDLGVNLRWGHGKGMKAARNAIHRDYPVGTELVCVDDDIRDVKELVAPGSKPRFGTDTPPGKRYGDTMPIRDMDAMIRHAFREAGGCLWGVYPAANPLSMKPRINRGLAYVIGACYGFTVRREPHELVELDDKEDFERSVRFFLRDGALARIEYVGLITDYYKTPGGMQDYRTEQTVAGGALQLQGMFPGLVKAYKHHRTGHWEVRFVNPARLAR